MLSSGDVGPPGQRSFDARLPVLEESPENLNALRRAFVLEAVFVDQADAHNPSSFATCASQFLLVSLCPPAIKQPALRPIILLQYSMRPQTSTRD
jgi:hypothetical protein